MLSWRGRGGFGDVWQARHIELDQQRALKVLRLDRFSPEEQDLLDGRGTHEWAQLPPHTNRVHVIDIAEQDGHLVLVMAYVQGGVLGERYAASIERCSPLPARHRRGAGRPAWPRHPAPGYQARKLPLGRRVRVPGGAERLRAGRPA